MVYEEESATRAFPTGYEEENLEKLLEELEEIEIRSPSDRDQ